LITRWILTFDPNESSLDSMNETDRLLIQMSYEVRERVKYFKD